MPKSWMNVQYGGASAAATSMPLNGRFLRFRLSLRRDRPRRRWGIGLLALATTLLALTTAGLPLAQAQGVQSTSPLIRIDAWLGRGADQWQRVTLWLLLAGAGIVVGAMLLRSTWLLFCFWLAPARLLRLRDSNQRLKLTFLEESILLDPMTPFLKQQPRVLDAWVAQNTKKVKESFEQLEAWRERRIHVDLPVKFNGETRKIKADDLPIASLGDATHLVLITGVGGAGKTSLAFRLCSWGMQCRLTAYPVLPVLIEEELAKEETLAARVRQLLTRACGFKEEELGLTFVEALLRERRVIVIVDHFSELSGETRKNFVKKLPMGLVIITSRMQEKDQFRQQTVTRLEPMSIDEDDLQTFFNDYLSDRTIGAEATKITDFEKDAARQQFRKMMGIKNITPLLAKMYIEDWLATRAAGASLPSDVHSLMLRYLQRLNEAIPVQERMPTDSVQSAVRCLALASLEQSPEGHHSYTAIEFDQRLALQALKELQGAERTDHREEPLQILRYLRDRLGVIYHNKPGDVHNYRFLLDPLADAMAAQQKLEVLQHDGGWQSFLENLERRLNEPWLEDPILAMAGFLQFLVDACTYYRPKFAPQEEFMVRLRKLANVDPRKEQELQDRLRIRRRKLDLMASETSECLKALDGLKTMALERRELPQAASLCVV